MCFFSQTNTPSFLCAIDNFENEKSKKYEHNQCSKKDPKIFNSKLLYFFPVENIIIIFEPSRPGTPTPSRAMFFTKNGQLLGNAVEVATAQTLLPNRRFPPVSSASGGRGSLVEQQKIMDSVLLVVKMNYSVGGQMISGVVVGCVSDTYHLAVSVTQYSGIFSPRMFTTYR